MGSPPSGDKLDAVTDSQGVAEDISDVVKAINDGIYSLNFGDGKGSLQLSVTQSQSVDGTEPVTQVDDVALQLQFEDERIRKKKGDHLRRKELERHQKATCMQPQVDVHAQAIRDEGGADAGATGHPVAGGTDIPAKLNLLKTRLNQVFPHDGVKVKKAIAKRKVRDANSDVTPRRSPRAKVACQTSDKEADVDNLAVKIGPSTLGGSPVRRSPRVLAYIKASLSPIPEGSKGK